MAYTHTLTIRLNGLTFEAEIDFNGSKKPKIKTTENYEMTVCQNERLLELINCFLKIKKQCLAIEKIELVRIH